MFCAGTTSAADRITCAKRGLPPTSCRTLGRFDLSRVPFPAAMMAIAKSCDDMEFMLRQRERPEAALSANSVARSWNMVLAGLLRHSVGNGSERRNRVQPLLEDAPSRQPSGSPRLESRAHAASAVRLNEP